ncbi:MAG: sugar ABC transporter permease [Spirochaetaceae bacterium]|nr:MAG: sugar ABC transporter permease [Spirochaetaceae bacterium]
MAKRYSSLAAREARLAFWMLTPAFLIVAAIILFPVAANFWISFKSVGLGDLRAPVPIVREQVTSQPRAAGDELVVVLRARNSSREWPLQTVTIRATLPPGAEPHTLGPEWRLERNRLIGEFGTWEGGHIQDIELSFTVTEEFLRSDVNPRAPLEVSATARSRNALTSLDFTLDNFRFVISAREFTSALITSFVYPFFGAFWSILFGLCAAQLLNRKFPGQGTLRGLFLFPYVAPVIAVAFAWVFFLDPFSGTVNLLAVDWGVLSAPVSFLSERNTTVSLFGLSLRVPLALTTVIMFDGWRYFPFSFLFLLARLQAIPSELYESADVDGAGTFRKFSAITLPQLRGVIATLFLLRFMWTFNKFDDVFLLTGGAAGTRTLPIQVYDNAFGRGNIGAGSATAVILFVFLAVFMLIYFRAVREVADE